MSWNHIESNWKSLKNTIQQNWTQLTDEDVQKINGNRDLLISTIQEKYASSRSDAQTEVENWQNKQAESTTKHTGNQENKASDAKYNPDYSGSDSDLTHKNGQNSGDKKPGSLSNDSVSSDQANQHKEKSLDQT